MISSPASRPANANQPHPGIRLSIFHVMLWMAATGVLLAVVRPAFRQDFSTSGHGHLRIVVFKVLLAVFAPIQGAALTGFLLAAWRPLRPGPSFPAQPGHWLLINVGGWVLVYISSGILGQMRLVYGDSPALKLIDFLNWVVPIALCALAASWICRHKCYGWLPPMIGAAIHLIGPFYLSAVMSPVMFNMMSVITFTALVGAVIADVVQRHRYDFFHWTGVVVMGATLLRAVPYWFV